MLSREENERLTRVGPGTPMGAMMRRYWMPALLSWELPEPDGAPVRLRLLGEDLVAFRTTDGEVGIVEEFCPHRGASLWLGRNEANGLRCVFHGWKFDRGGQCVEQMNEPQPFCNKVKITAYPTVEMGGVVWTYMGPKEQQPAPPRFDWTLYAQPQLAVSKGVQECNWLQALEGGIDTSHFTILHRALKANARQAGVFSETPGLDRAPTLEVDLTDYGYAYYGVRPLENESVYVRAYHFVMPFTALRPPGEGRKQVHGHSWVPIDDETCMVWNFFYSYAGEDLTSRIDDHRGGNSYGDFIDIENGFRPVRNRSNGWMIDRKMQKTETFTGIEGINQQDRAVQESMKPIVDRTREHLGPADKAIIAMRKVLLQAVDTVAAGGDPPGVSDSYHELRAMEGVFQRGIDWRAELRAGMYPRSHGRAAAAE
jgi:phenylpropionate dioxygenase-like ring-hydroxylating dioxygenase large terminal subunit